MKQNRLNLLPSDKVKRGYFVNDKGFLIELSFGSGEYPVSYSLISRVKELDKHVYFYSQAVIDYADKELNLTFCKEY